MEAKIHVTCVSRSIVRFQVEMDFVLLPPDSQGGSLEVTLLGSLYLPSPSVGAMQVIPT